jgi:ATP-binding cassette, subfamily B, bacterial PglK
MLLKDLKLITTKKQHRFFYVIQILITLSAIFEVLSIFVVIPFVTFIMGIESTNSSKYFQIYSLIFNDVNSNNIVFISGYVAIILFVISTFLSLAVNTLAIYFANQTAASITNNLYRKFLNKEWLFHALNPGEKLISRIVNDAGKINRVIVNLFTINFNSIKTVFIIVAIFFYNFKIALILSITFILSYTVIYLILKSKLYIAGEKLSNEQRNIQKRMTESFGVIKEIIISNNYDLFLNYFAKDRNKISKRESFINSASFLPRYIIETVGITMSMILIIYTYSIYGGISQAIVMLAVFTFASLKLIPHFQQIFFSLAELKSFSASFERVKNDLTNLEYDQKIESPHQNDLNIDLKNIKNLELKNISFFYPNSNLSSLEVSNLQIPLKSKIAIAGESGSGKTTLINILTGLIKTEKGNFFLDDYELKNEHFQKFQKNIGIVPQNIFLFDDTILNNISLKQKSEKVDLKRIKEILEICDLTMFVESLPNGMNTRIGEKGVNLSGGQQQKLGIARCIYFNKDLFIFDEATNSMDAISESKIINNIIEYDRNKTIILISHNYSTFKNFDHIIFFENGKINEIGTYEFLIKNNLKFKKLANEEKKNEKILS